MPKENRKRGKKYKKKVEEAANNKVQAAAHDVEQQNSQPSWIVSVPKVPELPEITVDSDAPFGYVDADVKTYFRTVDIQIRDWQESHDGGDQGIDDNNDRNEGM